MAVPPRVGSKPYRDRLRARLLALGFAEEHLPAQLAQDLIRHGDKRPREAWRLACELSLDEVAARFNSLTRDPGATMRKSRIWDYEQWPRSGHRPTVTTLRRLAQIYRTTWERLVDLEDLGRMPCEDREAFHATVAARQRMSSPGVTAVRAVVAPEDEIAVDPDSTRSDGPDLIEGAAEESAQLATWAAASNIDQDTLAQLHREVRAISHAYVFSPPYPLFVRARKLRNRVAKLLRGRQRWPQTRELYLIGARACTLMAWMSGDLGNYAAAGDHGWAGWMCAQHADHDGARAWVRATQSKLAFWDGDYVESAQLAQAGLGHRTRSSVTLLLHLLEARAWARLGRVDDAAAAISQWRDQQPNMTEEEVGGVLGLSQAQQHYLAGSTCLWLREPGQALVETNHSIELFERTPLEQRFYGAEMLARIDASRAHLGVGDCGGHCDNGAGRGPTRSAASEAGAGCAGRRAAADLDAAAAALEPVLALSAEHRLETFTQNLSQVRAMLATPQYRGNHQAQGLQELIEDYTSGAVSRTLELRP